MSFRVGYVYMSIDARWDLDFGHNGKVLNAEKMPKE
jgi:hypothetical protein